jgi:hypothetical protein
MWDPWCFTTLWASTACYRDSFNFFLYTLYIPEYGTLCNHHCENLKSILQTWKIYFKLRSWDHSGSWCPALGIHTECLPKVHISIMSGLVTGGSVQFNMISNLFTHYKTTGITAHCEVWSSCGGTTPVFVIISIEWRWWVARITLPATSHLALPHPMNSRMGGR